MALESSALATDLANLTPQSTEASAIIKFANAYGSYASQATAMGIQMSAPIASDAQAAMAAGLTGLSTAGAAAIVTGITAYWSTVDLGLASSFTGALVLTPPLGLAGLPAALVTVFAANTSGSVDLIDAMQALADALHTGSLGGFATFPGAPPIVAPIL